MTSSTIIRVVAQRYGVTPRAILGPCRAARISLFRAMAMYLARTLVAGASYPALGRDFGGRHHTTIMTAVEKVTRLIATDAFVRSEVAEIEKLAKHEDETVARYL